MIIEKACAKINLALDVLGKREDNYHNLRMVMTTVDLFDRISYDKIYEDKLIINSNRYYLPNDERNLAYKAAKLMKDTFAIKAGIKIYISKNIPVAAGLAGGSSDAASTIRAINRMFKLGLNIDEMMELGKEIGSDVPFCIYGKTALVEGKGEIIKPIAKVPKCWVVLVKPHFGVSTKEIFENIDFSIMHHPNVDGVIESIENDDYFSMCKVLGNSLESVTFRLYPDVNEVKNKLHNLGVDAALMSGSGPTVFALVQKERRAKAILNSLDRNRYEVHAVRILG